MPVSFQPFRQSNMLNTPEIIAIGVVVFIFVGAKRMPELAKSLGQGIREFKKAANDATDEAMKAIAEHDARREQDQNPEALPNQQDKKTNPDLPLNQTSMKSESAK